jgi:hypothetical protein
MAVPTDLTATNLVTESYGKIGMPDPTAAEITRAKDYFLQDIFNDLWTAAEVRGNTRFRTLQDFEVQITTVGQSKYDFPSDFYEEIDISILDGDHTGTAQAGGNTSIDYASDEDATEAEVVGEYTLLTSGTGKGSDGLRQNVAYNTTTVQATVDRAWTTNPASDSTYLIVNKIDSLCPDGIVSLGRLGTVTSVGKPSSYARIVEGANNRFVLDKPSDKATYGLLVTYYAKLNKVDLTEGATTLITKIYNTWRNVLTIGVAFKAAESNQMVEKIESLFQQYQFAKEGLLDNEVPYNEEFTGFEL